MAIATLSKGAGGRSKTIARFILRIFALSRIQIGGIKMAFGDASGTDIRRVEDAINRFSNVSTKLSICMIILAVAQVFLGIMMWLKR